MTATVVVRASTALPYRRLTPLACRQAGQQRARRIRSRGHKCASLRAAFGSGSRRNYANVFPQVTSGIRPSVTTNGVGWLCCGELTINGSVHLRARDYDPKTGTFTTTDALDGVDGTPTVSNKYHYTEHDPLNKQDPTGLQPTQDGDLSCSRNIRITVRASSGEVGPPRSCIQFVSTSSHDPQCTNLGCHVSQDNSNIPFSVPTLQEINSYKVFETFRCVSPVLPPGIKEEGGCRSAGYEGAAVTIVGVPTLDPKTGQPVAGFPVLRVNKDIAFLVRYLVVYAAHEGVALSTAGGSADARTCDYRPSAQQQEIWVQFCVPFRTGCGVQVGYPGNSNHEPGVAIDFNDAPGQAWMYQTGQFVNDPQERHQSNAVNGADPPHFSTNGH